MNFKLIFRTTLDILILVGLIFYLVTWLAGTEPSLTEDQVRGIVQEELDKVTQPVQESVRIAPKIIYPDQSESVEILVQNSPCWIDYPVAEGVSVRKQWTLKTWEDTIYTGTLRFEERRTTKIINETIKQVTVDMQQREVTC